VSWLCGVVNGNCYCNDNRFCVVCDANSNRSASCMAAGDFQAGGSRSSNWWCYPIFPQSNLDSTVFAVVSRTKVLQGVADWSVGYSKECGKDLKKIAYGDCDKGSCHMAMSDNGRRIPPGYPYVFFELHCHNFWPWDHCKFELDLSITSTHYPYTPNQGCIVNLNEMNQEQNRCC